MELLSYLHRIIMQNYCLCFSVIFNKVELYNLQAISLIRMSAEGKPLLEVVGSEISSKTLEEGLETINLNEVL